MKESNKLLLAVLLPLLTATACSDNDLTTATQPEQTTAETCYIGCQLHLIGNGTTRATYVPGTAKENSISNILIAFYDADGNYLHTDLIDKSQFTDGNRFVATIQKGKNPAKVLAFVNMVEFKSTIEGLSYSEALAKQSGNMGNGLAADSACFMTSSAYINGNQIMTGSNIVATIYPEFPETALEGELLNLYVERVSAKAIVSLSPNIVIELPKSNGKEVTFDLQGYSINGFNRSCYITKNISLDFDNLGWTDAWNAADLHRSFWAKDCNYNEGGVANNDAYLYFTYQQLVGKTGHMQYCLENTSADTPDVLNIQNATHAIVVGQYTLEGTPTGTHLYLWNGRLMTASDYQQSVAAINPVYRSTTQGYEKLATNLYKVYRQGVNGKDAAVVAIQLKDITETLYTKTETGYEVISLDDVNAELLKTGSAIKYGHGKCYYAMPLRHLGDESKTGYYGMVRNHWYSVIIEEIKSYGNGIYDPGHDPDDPDPVDPTIEPDDPSNNDGDEGEVIIPEPQKTDKNYYFGASVDVLDWSVVENNITL